MAFRASISSRILLLILFSVLVTLVASGFLVEQRLHEMELTTARQELQKAFDLNTADFSTLMNDAYLSELRKFTSEVAESQNLRVTVFDALLSPLADSAPTLNNADNFSERPELNLEQGQDSATALRYSNVGDELYFWQTERLYSEGAMVGYLRFGFSMASLEETVGALRWSYLFSGAAAALLLMIPAGILARQLSTPLVRLSRQVSRPIDSPYLMDDYQFRNDEFGLMARSIAKSRDRFRQELAALEQDRTIYLRSLLSMDEGLITIDTDEEIIFINDLAARLFSTTVEMARGAQLWEIVRNHPFAKEFHYIIDEDRVERREVRYFDDSGEERYARLYPSILYNKASERVGMVFLLRDVTQMKKLLQSREDLITNVSHEFKTPLTAIQGITETLQDDPEMPVEMRNTFLERVQRQGSRLKRIAENLVELVRIEAEHTDERLIDIDCREVVKETLEDFSERFRQKNIKLVQESAQEPLEITIRPNALRQIVENLLDNALKYTPEGGTITVRTSAQETMAQIEVSDTGIGIAEADLPRIFERFYRTSAARTPGIEGTGLGLAILKSLVEYYEGEVSVSSFEGTGSVFSVRLPLIP